MLKAISAQKADVPKLKNITANPSSTPVFSREETPSSQRTKSEDMYSSDDDVPLASKYVSSYYSIYLASSYCCISSVRILLYIYAYYDISSVLILLYLCPQTATCRFAAKLTGARAILQVMRLRQ